MEEVVLGVLEGEEREKLEMDERVSLALGAGRWDEERDGVQEGLGKGQGSEAKDEWWSGQR